MRSAHLALTLLLPAVCLAENVNPFQPGAERPKVAVFGPAPAEKAPTRIPPPLPLIVQETSRAEVAPSLLPPPAQAPAPVPKRSCSIHVSPSAPLIGAQGGEFVLTVSEESRNHGCVAGLESRAAWLKIRYFNGEKLTLQAEPNKDGKARRAELIFANMNDSLVLRVLQAAP